MFGKGVDVTMQGSGKKSRNTTSQILSETFNVAAFCLCNNLEQHPEKTAFIFEDGITTTVYSYRQVGEQVMRWTRWLQAMDLQPPQRVLIRLSHEPMYVIAFLAVVAAGLVAVPVSPQWTASEVHFLQQDSKSSVVLTDQTFLRQELWPKDVQVVDLALQQEECGKTVEHSSADFFCVGTCAEDPAYLIYTSGTTGRPKGVLHAHRSVWGRRPMLAGWSDIQPDDIVLHTGHLNWTYTMGVGIFDTWSVGATSVFYGGRKNPGMWSALIEKHQVTIMASVPTLYRQMLSHHETNVTALRGLRHGLTAGEALSPELLTRWQEKVGCPLYEALGMSECSTYISTGPHIPIRPGSPGKPQPERIVCILDPHTKQPCPPGEVGLLAVHRSDPGLMLRYWNRPEEDQEVFHGDWFVGGDLASFDHDGYLWFHGRNNDLMNSFGYRVSPLEIELVLEQHPAVQEAGVTELQIRPDVSVICAWIVPNPNFHPDAHVNADITSSSQTAEDLKPSPKQEEGKALQQWCGLHLARYKCPREYRWVSELPRTLSGKLQRHLLSTIAVQDSHTVRVVSDPVYSNNTSFVKGVHHDPNLL